MTHLIRLAQIEDYEGISRLVAQIQQLHVEARPDIYAPCDNPMGIHYYRKILREERTAVIVAVYDNKGVHRCTIQITENYETPYGLIDLRVAEGECYDKLEAFIVDHDECWAEDMLKAGFELTKETIIVVEHFKLLEVLV